MNNVSVFSVFSFLSLSSVGLDLDGVAPVGVDAVVGGEALELRLPCLITTIFSDFLSENS